MGVDHFPSEEEVLAFYEWWPAGKKRVLDSSLQALPVWLGAEESCRRGVEISLAQLTSTDG